MARRLALVAVLAVASAALVGVGVDNAGPAGASVHRVQLASAITDQPVYDGDFADPTVLVVDGTYYAYGTNAGEEDTPVIESTDLVHWKAVGDAMSIPPPWAEEGFIWSPSVAPERGGGYEMFFSAWDKTTGHQCIGRATAPSPLGPFVDSQPGPFLCETALGGAIDPSVYSAHGADYLVWKSDGEQGQAQEIWGEQLATGDQRLLGEPVLLLTASRSWEDGIVEGPTLAQLGNTLYLFFGGNKWTSAHYAIGAVTCSSPLGPCAAAGPTPVLASTASAVGPGGPAVFSVGQQTLMAYAAWPDDQLTADGGHRELYLAVVSATGVGALSVQA